MTGPTADFLTALAAEGSPAMVERLRAKPGAERVTVTAGDFPTAAAGRSLRLVYLVCNTIGNLASQDDQVECFRNAAAHLEPGGHFVTEVGLPDLRWLPPGQAKYPMPLWSDICSMPVDWQAVQIWLFWNRLSLGLPLGAGSQGGIYRDTGRRAEALADLDRAIGPKPGDAWALREREQT